MEPVLTDNQTFLQLFQTSILIHQSKLNESRTEIQSDVSDVISKKASFSDKTRSTQ